MRPRSLDEVVGQDELLGPGKPLRVLIEGDRLSSVVLWGPGEEALASAVASAAPDFYFPEYKLAVFIDGCFWHACPTCGRLPKSRIDFWHTKIDEN